MRNSKGVDLNAGSRYADHRHASEMIGNDLETFLDLVEQRAFGGYVSAHGISYDIDSIVDKQTIRLNVDAEEIEPNDD